MLNLENLCDSEFQTTIFEISLFYKKGILTLSDKITNKLAALILLKMVERSEAKIAKRSFATKSLFDAKLRFAL